MTRRAIHDELLTVDHPVLGRRVAVMVPTIPETAPSRIREGIARRRIVAMTGACPCGAEATYGNVVLGEVVDVDVLHEHGCPAVTDPLVRAVRWWLR